MTWHGKINLFFCHLCGLKISIVSLFLAECPMFDIDFPGGDNSYTQNVATWEECGKF